MREDAFVRRLGMAVVRGRSMLPTLREGDRLVVRYDDRDPSPGQLVVARLPGGVVAVKRVTACSSGDVVLESDNAREGFSGIVDGRAVLAVVVARVWPRPHLGSGLRRRRPDMTP